MDEKVLLELKPKFVPYLRFIYNLPIGHAFGSLIAVLILGGFPLLAAIFELKYLAWVFKIYESQYWFAYAMGIVLGLIILSSVILTYFDKKNYAITSYTLYRDRILSNEGFINHKRRTCILAINIEEIHFTQNFLQRMSNVGSIKIITAGYANYNTGFLIKDIENSREIYNQIDDIYNQDKEIYEKFHI